MHPSDLVLWFPNFSGCLAQSPSQGGDGYCQYARSHCKADPVAEGKYDWIVVHFAA